MADLIEIGVEVRTNSVRSATKEVDSLGKTLKSAERSASAFVDAFARQERQVSKAAIANKVYSSTAQKMYNEILKIDTATKSASASASVFAAKLDKEAKAAAQVAKENDRLKSKFVEGYTAMNIYTKELNELAIARKRDIITSEQQKAAVAQLNAQMKAGTGAFANAATNMQIVGKRANRSGVLMQQAGYQFGDFAVQVQSGTNVMVAFGQQATQLIGTFSMLAKSTRMIALFSGLGVVVPILTAIGAALIRTGKNAKDAAKDVDEYANALNRLKGELQDLTQARLAATTSFDPDALVASQKRVELANRIAQTELDLLTLKGRNRKGLAETLASLKEQLATENARFSAFMKRLNTEREAAEQRKADAEWEEGAADRLANRLSQRNDFMEYYNKLQDDLKAKKDADTSAQEELDLLTQKNVLLDLELQYGKDSSVYKQMALGYEEDNLRAKLEAKGVDETIIAAQIEALLIQKGITQELADQLALKKLQAQFEQKPQGGRGGDPRKQGGGFIDWNTIEATKFLKDYEKNLRKATKATEDADKAAEALRKELEAPMVKAIDSVSNAFGDFIADGLKDFKSFASSIVDSFKSMIAQMIATAARNKIMLSMGLGGSGFAAQAAAGNVAGVGGNSFGGPLGSMIGSFGTGGGFGGGTGLLGGIGGIASGMSGIFSGGGLSASFANLGGLMSGSVGGMGAIGAALPALGAVAVVIGLLSKKTKLLDSGLRTTVEGFDVAIETFKKTQTSRLFGLLKGSKKTAYEAASAEVADPLIEAIGNMQQSIVDAAGTLGIGANAFDDFSYQFKLSLKGLTEEEQLQKINEEIVKMGDSFASLTGHFETMNELLEAANQRMQLQNRLDQLLGNNQAILTRQREAELKAMHELNRPLAQMVYNLEDAQASVQSAFASLGASIEAEKNRLRDAFTSIVDGLNKRLDVANETMARSNNIYSMLESAVSGRSITSGIGQSLSRREGALGFIRGGDFSDERKLEEALDVVAEPSEGLFSSFVDYARDFARTSITLEEAKKVAQVQLTADEKSVLLLEEQIAQAQVDLDAQLEALDKQYQMEVDQYNALLGIDTSVKSVTEAIGTLKSAIEALASAQAAAKAAAAVGTAGAGTGAAAAGIKLTGEKYQGYDLGNIRGAADLMAAAAQNNIQTSGKTGAQIQQAISNATGLAINMDNATRGKQFAMGGYHTGGLRMVGERGPEIEATGPSRIFSHNQTASMFKDPELVSEVRNLRSEVSGLRSEQRQMQASNVKYVKRNYDINRKWDTDGLPATRTS